jgi:hypothetical protein
MKTQRGGGFAGKIPFFGLKTGLNSVNGKFLPVRRKLNKSDPGPQSRQTAMESWIKGLLLPP